MAKPSRRKPDSEVKEWVDKIKAAGPTAGRRIEMSWELLTEIKGQLLTNPTIKNVLGILSIHKHTWDRWRQEGERIYDSLQEGAENQRDYADLKEREQMLVNFVYILRTSKPKTIQKHWSYLTNQAKDNFQANKFALQVLDRETFNLEARIKHSGYIAQPEPEEQDRIAAELEQFGARDTLEDLIDDEGSAESSS
jgi:hypothetical protein